MRERIVFEVEGGTLEITQMTVMVSFKLTFGDGVIHGQGRTVEHAKTVAGELYLERTGRELVFAEEKKKTTAKDDK